MWTTAPRFGTPYQATRPVDVRTGRESWPAQATGSSRHDEKQSLSSKPTTRAHRHSLSRTVFVTQSVSLCQRCDESIEAVW